MMYVLNTCEEVYETCWWWCNWLRSTVGTTLLSAGELSLCCTILL